MTKYRDMTPEQREAHKAKVIKWRAEHPEKYKEYRKKSNDKHREKYNEQKRKRRKRIREDPELKKKLRERVKKKREMNPERYKAHSRKYYASHREECISRAKKWRVENPEKYREQRKKWKAEHREEFNAHMRKQMANDLNKNGVPKHNIRQRSKQILYKTHSKIPGYEIHHAFGYDDSNRFIYIPKTLHQKIHQLLRDKNIPSDSNHWNSIRDIVNSYEGYTYIRT